MRFYLALLFSLFSAALAANLKHLQTIDNNPPEQLSSKSSLLDLLFFGDIQNSTTGDEYSCVFCVMLVNALETHVLQKNQVIDSFLLKDYCNRFDSSAKAVCQKALLVNGPKVLKAIDKSSNPDKVCRELKLCTNPLCNLYPKGQAPKLKRDKGLLNKFRSSFNFDLSQTLNSLFKANNSDSDGDGFASNIITNYDTIWKGKDCDNSNNQIYPGRNVNLIPGGPDDYNCNGMSGYVPDFGTPYKDLYCTRAARIGIAVSGDSLGTNFQIPTAWFNASQWIVNSDDSSSLNNNISNVTSYGEGIISLVQDNIDIPQFGGFTGTCENSGIQPCRSLYTYNLNNNLCNFNDFQNIAVNGATLNDTVTNIKNLRRQQTLDAPLLLVLEVFGNDVCKLNMTTSDEFRQSLREILAYLDTTLPPGSHLLVLGVLDVDLYPLVANSTHVSGRTYQDFHEFLLCLGVTNKIGCPTLMNPDDNLRKEALQRTRDLNLIYVDELDNLKSKNFDAAFVGFPSIDTLNQLAGYTIDPIDLVNKVDGFHPSQLTQSLLADYLWNYIQENHPDWVGAPNEFNPAIQRAFPNQFSSI